MRHSLNIHKAGNISDLIPQKLSELKFSEAVEQVAQRGGRSLETLKVRLDRALST